MSDMETLPAVEEKYRCRLRQVRDSKGMNQGKLAEMTNINRATLSLLENNRLFLSSKNALVLRDALGCTMDELYERRG